MRFSNDKLERLSISSEIIEGYTAPGTNRDSMVGTLLKKHVASHAIVITSLNAFFDQTNVDVTKEESGKKERTAYYDIVSDTGFAFYQPNSLIEMSMHRNFFHSSRSVISGLFALSPGIISRKKDIEKTTMENTQDFLNYFFPGEEIRSQVVFTQKPFTAVAKAIAKADYEATMVENLRLVNDANRSTAAQAIIIVPSFLKGKTSPVKQKIIYARLFH